MNNRILCIGGVTIDRKFRAFNKLRLGTSNPAASITTMGGVAHNVAKNLSQLTNNIHLYSVIGDDNEGAQILKAVQSSGIHTENLLTLQNTSSAYYHAILDIEGELHLALGDMAIFDAIPFDLFTQSWEEWTSTDLVFLDTNLPTAIIAHALHISKQKNIRVCIDPVSAIKANKLPANLEHVFLLKPDRQEAEVLANFAIDSIADCIKAGQILLAKGVENCIISLGKLGYVIVNHSVQDHFPSLSVDSIVDVSGAGDAFIAGILYELKQGSCLVTASHTGARAAALTIQSCHTVSEQVNCSHLEDRLH